MAHQVNPRGQEIPPLPENRYQWPRWIKDVDQVAEANGWAGTAAKPRLMQELPRALVNSSMKDWYGGLPAQGTAGANGNPRGNWVHFLHHFRQHLPVDLEMHIKRQLMTRKQGLTETVHSYGTALQQANDTLDGNGLSADELYSCFLHGLASLDLKLLSQKQRAAHPGADVQRLAMLITLEAQALGMDVTRTPAAEPVRQVNPAPSPWPVLPVPPVTPTRGPVLLPSFTPTIEPPLGLPAHMVGMVPGVLPPQAWYGMPPVAPPTVAAGGGGMPEPEAAQANQAKAVIDKAVEAARIEELVMAALEKATKKRGREGAYTGDGHPACSTCGSDRHLDRNCPERRPWCPECRVGGHTKANCWGACKHCGRRGHRASECRTLDRNGGGGRGNRRREEEDRDRKDGPDRRKGNPDRRDRSPDSRSRSPERASDRAKRLVTAAIKTATSQESDPGHYGPDDRGLDN